MKNLFFALAALLVFGWAAQPAQAATNGFQWEHFGADPYATTKVEGMRTRQQAFGCLGIPQGAIDLLMKETEHAGETVRLVKGDHLDKMVSKGCKVHDNVTVAFTAPVHNMEYAAPGERWSVVFEGKRYVVTRPDICNNWSLVVIILPSPPVVQKPDCATIWVPMEVPEGMTVTGVTYEIAGSQPVPRSTVCHFKGPLSDGCCTFRDAEGDVLSQTHDVITYRDIRQVVNPPRMKWMKLEVSTDVLNGYYFFVCLQVIDKDGVARVWYGKALLFHPDTQRRNFIVPPFEHEN